MNETVSYKEVEGMVERSGREVAILDAALDLVTEVGFDCVTMDAVASRAHASKATIYRYWPGKAELVADAVRCRACVDVHPPATGSLRGDLLAAMAVMAEAMTGSDGELMFGLLTASHRDPQLAALMRESVYESKRSVWREICDRAVHAGELVDQAQAVEVLLEVVPALAFLQHVVLAAALDEAWRAHVVDAVVLPLLRSLTVAAPQPA